MSGNKPVRLPARFLEKIWGATDLSPWYPSSTQKIGEVWFEADLPLLVKFVFTSDRLSVQVHPDDEFAQAHENSRGKTEMWYVLRADPGARIAIGFRQSISRERLRESALNGEIEDLLQWVDVKAGRCVLRSRRHRPCHRRRTRAVRDPAIFRHHLSALRLRPPARIASGKSYPGGIARKPDAAGPVAAADRLPVFSH